MVGIWIFILGLHQIILQHFPWENNKNFKTYQKQWSWIRSATNTSYIIWFKKTQNIHVARIIRLLDIKFWSVFCRQCKILLCQRAWKKEKFALRNISLKNARKHVLTSWAFRGLYRWLIPTWYLHMHHLRNFILPPYIIFLGNFRMSMIPWFAGPLVIQYVYSLAYEEEIE